MSENSSSEGWPAMISIETIKNKVPKPAQKLQYKLINRLRVPLHPSRGSYGIWLGLSKEWLLQHILIITQGQVPALVVVHPDVSPTVVVSCHQQVQTAD